MKESTGGALLMGLAAGIIIIFIIMVAFFISYGKTFRIKNEMINYIEQNEGVEKGSLGDSFVNKGNAYNGKTIEACYNEIRDNNGSLKGFTVKVVVYMEMDRTILGDKFNVKIPVSGETRIIEKGNYISNPENMDLNECSSGNLSKILENGQVQN